MHFLVEVNGAPAGSFLEVTVPATGQVLATFSDPDGTLGIGPNFFPMGVTELAVRLLDASGSPLLEDSVLVTIEDRTPPDISGCGPVTLECRGPETILYASDLGITVEDDCDPSPELTFVPPSVSMGTTVVTARATDDTGNVSECSFDVTVVDTLPPLFSEFPEDISRECTSSEGAFITFEVAAIDACGIASFTCEDQTGRTVDGAGTWFEDGIHTVTCTAVDPHGNSASRSFLVEVVDNTAPVLVAPDDITVGNDPGQCSAAVNFVVVATDICDPDVPVVCIADWGEEVSSGDSFPVGTTTVTCTAVDEAGNSAVVTFAITVLDTEAPVFGGTAGGSVTLVTDCAGTDLGIDLESLGLTVEDNCGGSVATACDPTVLSPGLSTVTCTAVDAAGNHATTTVEVTVLKGPLDCEVLRPLDAHVDNRINPGQVVPIKLRVSCENIEISTATVTIDSIEILDATGTPIANETVEDPGLSEDDGVVFRQIDSHYHFNLSTAAWNDAKGTRHRVGIRIAKAGHVDSICYVFLLNK